MTSSLDTRLERMSLNSDSSSTSKSFDPQAILSAFQESQEQSHDEIRRRRALAALALAQQSQEAGTVASHLNPVLRSGLAEDSQAALRLLTALYAIAPQEAHELLFGSYDLHGVVFPKITSQAEVSRTWDILRAEMLASATGHLSSRTALKSATHASALDFLSTSSSSSSDDETLAMVAQLARYKLFRGPSESQQVGGSEDTSINISVTDEDRLLALAKKHITSTDTTQSDDDDDHTHAHSVLLLALEALGYLSTIPRIKDAIARDVAFLTRLCTLAQDTPAKKQVFPSRNTDTNTHAQSTYDIKSTSNGTGTAPDTPLHYAICVILLHLVSLPETLSSEQKQLRKLTDLANASSNTKSSASSAAPDPRESIDAINKRSDAMISAGGVKFLVQSVSASSTSLALRSTLGQVFLALTTKQDRARRGLIAQHGGGKALLALSAMVLREENESDAKKGQSNSTMPSPTAATSTLAPLQSLAHLCITSSPAILFTNPTLPLSSLVILYLHASATPLQRFEGLLALTNLSSLDVEIAARVMSSRLPSGSGSADGQTVAEAMESSILLDDNPLIRRAAVELLCNALSANIPSVIEHWGGAKAGTRVHLLVALCGETDVQLKLAAAACVALLCSSSEDACGLVLGLEVRTLKIAAEVVLSAADTTAKIRQLDEDEDEPPSAEDVSMSQVDALGLSLRGLTLVSALVDYTRRIKADTSKLRTSGILQAVKDVYNDVVADLKVFLSQGGRTTSQVDAQVRDLQRQVVELSRGILS